MKKPCGVITVLFLALATALVGQQVSGTSEKLLKLFESGDTAGILKILEADPQQLKADLGEGMTPLHYAAYTGNETVFDYLIKRGLDLHATDKRGLTPVWFTVSGARPAMLKKPIALGADLDVVDGRTGKTMLHEAALRGNSALVKKLLAADIRKDAKDKNGFTALSYALKYGHKTAANLLRNAGVEEVPWETNLDNSTYLKKSLGGGEAYIWYLGHPGWALKTKSAFLVFDYKDRPVAPDERLLANGHIRPDIAFLLNTYAPHDSDAEAEARQKGIFYAVEKLKIKSVLPMHGGDREEACALLVEGAAKNKVKVDVGAAVNRGDRFFFSKGALK